MSNKSRPCEHENWWLFKMFIPGAEEGAHRRARRTQWSQEQRKPVVKRKPIWAQMLQKWTNQADHEYMKVHCILRFRGYVIGICSKCRSGGGKNLNQAQNNLRKRVMVGGTSCSPWVQTPPPLGRQITPEWRSEFTGTEGPTTQWALLQPGTSQGTK